MKPQGETDCFSQGPFALQEGPSQDDIFFFLTCTTLSRFLGHAPDLNVIHYDSLEYMFLSGKSIHSKFRSNCAIRSMRQFRDEKYIMLSTKWKSEGNYLHKGMVLDFTLKMWARKALFCSGFQEMYLSLPLQLPGGRWPPGRAKKLFVHH